MAKINFQEILGKQAAAIEKPKPLPVGTYLCTNNKLPDFKEIGKEETPCAEFNFIVLAQGEDVDPADIAAFGDVRGKTIRHRMFLTEKSEYRTKEELIKVFGIEEGAKTLGQLFNETVNKQLLVTIKHSPTQDGTDVYAEVEALAAA